jgi:hypothetical protein
MELSIRRITSVVALLVCPTILIAACSSGHTAVPEVSSTTGPTVSARLDRCFIDHSPDHQAFAYVTAFNHSRTTHDIIVLIWMSTDEGAHSDLAVVHNVEPGRSGTRGTSNHIDDSHRPTCKITRVQAL